MSLTDRNKSLLNRVGILATAGIVGTTLLACGGKDTATTADSGGDASMCSKIHIGTQDQVINTAVGGAVVRELKVFEDLLPKDGKYVSLESRMLAGSRGGHIPSQFLLK